MSVCVCVCVNVFSVFKYSARNMFVENGVKPSCILNFDHQW